MSRKKKGLALGDMKNAALILVTAVIMISIGVTILGNMHDNAFDGAGVNETTWSQNISASGITGIGTFADWFGIIVLVIVAAVVLTIVLRSFGSSGY